MTDIAQKLNFMDKEIKDISKETGFSYTRVLTLLRQKELITIAIQLAQIHEHLDKHFPLPEPEKKI